MITPTQFQKKLLTWFKKSGRHDLPWQTRQTAYRVWVSEVMLQQTQVNTVIPYFIKFMERFPTLKTLALADEDEVFHHWSGLGFYARARNLHKTAKLIYIDHNGRFPKSVENLMKLPGIGRSTAGAILSLANKISTPILDGNVKRVLARVFMIEGYPEATHPKKIFWEVSEKLTPKDNARDYTQAIMDLGATLCTRDNPNCSLCPFKTNCLAYKSTTVDKFPFKKPQTKIPKKKVYFLIFQNEEKELFLKKRPPSGIWGGLWSFPEVNELNKLEEICLSQYNFKINETTHLTPIKHIFTHFQLLIKPLLLTGKEQDTKLMETGEQIWYNPSKQPPGGLPKPVATLLNLMRPIYVEKSLLQEAE